MPILIPQKFWPNLHGGKFLAQSPGGKFLGSEILTELSIRKILACERWDEYARMIFLYLYRPQEEVVTGFLILDPPFPLGRSFPPPKKIVGRLPS